MASHKFGNVARVPVPEVFDAQSHVDQTAQSRSGLVSRPSFKTSMGPSCVASFSRTTCAPDSVTVVTDTSPWGLGGVLVVNGAIVEASRLPLAQWTKSCFALRAETVRRSTSLRHQHWLWLCGCGATSGVLSDQWRAQGCTVRVRSDSVCALTLVLKLRSSCHGEYSHVRLLSTCSRPAVGSAGAHRQVKSQLGFSHRS